MRTISLISNNDDILYNALLNNNLLLFQNSYNKQYRINNKNILLLAAESGSINILSYIIQYEPSIFKKMNIIEKELWFDFIINLYPQESWKEQIINYVLENYKLSRKILSFLLLTMLKYGNLSLIKVILNKNVVLHNNNIIELLEWSKGAILNYQQKENLVYYFSLLIKNGHKKIFRLLSLSVGSNTEGYCLEIEVYNQLLVLEKRQWHNYLMSSNHILYHIHQPYLRAKIKDGFNIMDWNHDFLYILTYHFLIDIAEDIQNCEQGKINYPMLQKVYRVLNDNMILLGNIGIDLTKTINSIVLLSTLQNRLIKQEVKEEQRNKKI